MSRLHELDCLPDGILTVTPDSLHTLLPTPTLIHLQGLQPEPLFISVLLHGNEPTGFLALQMLLKKYSIQTLPRSVSVFFGNVQAAKHGLRHLDNQPDFNRIWPGTELSECEETRMMQEVYDIMAEKQPFASIDIHNNTGLNPHYACINRLDYPFLQLASLFGRLVVFFTRPKGVQSNSFAEICPAVTLECGRPGQQYGVEHAFEFLNSCINLTALPDHPLPDRDLAIYHTVAQVKIRDNIRFSFTDSDKDLFLDGELESMNFTEIVPGTLFGTVNLSNQMPVIAEDEHGNNVTDKFFTVRNKQLLIRRRTMPSMLTLDERVIKQDCLCYLMERLVL